MLTDLRRSESLGLDCPRFVAGVHQKVRGRLHESGWPADEHREPRQRGLAGGQDVGVDPARGHAPACRSGPGVDVGHLEAGIGACPLGQLARRAPRPLPPPPRPPPPPPPATSRTGPVSSALQTNQPPIGPRNSSGSPGARTSVRYGETSPSARRCTVSSSPVPPGGEAIE